MIFGLFTLLVAITISAVAAYYSIVGLTAIFAAAVIPIIIMGAALEVGKITAAVWLKLNWHRCSWTYKLYLVPAVAVLMLLTSMGIFGFLSKAHSDQNLVSGDVLSKIAIYDEKIKIAKENIDANRRALKQLDEAVDQVMGRSTTETGAERSVQIRRQQGPERQRLIREIEAEQKKINGLNEERAPIAAEVRKVEAEVGPVKYIAALIYGDYADTNLLEAAVRWVIIIIVAVFDPLALVLILAAQQSLRWAREEKYNSKLNSNPPNYEPDNGPLSSYQYEQIKESVDQKSTEENKFNLKYLTEPFVHFKNLKPMVYKPDIEKENTDEIKIENSTVEQQPGPPINVKKVGDDYFEVSGKKMHQKVFEHDFPQLAAAFKLRADNVSGNLAKSSFGLKFPESAVKGEMFLRVDHTPNKLFKYNGTKWIEVDKDLTDSYTYDHQYILFLIEKLQSGEYEIDQLNATEQELVAEELNKQKNDKT